ncbi:MAG: protein BatD [Acidobacteria bacterium]|nr:protein BatD [Acidobacteriota bacterium]MYG76297.1 protein BatD [Acidobacteriota bacterium]
MKRRLLATVFGVLLAPSVHAQEAAEARVDADHIGIEDTLTLTVSVPEERGGAPVLPDLAGFEVLGSQRMSRTEIVNFQMTRATEWIYRLRPLAVGELTIPAIPVPGYQPTLPIRVRVEQGSLRPGAPDPFASPFSSPFPSPFGLGDPFDRLRRRDPPAPEVREEDLFVRAEAPDSEVYVGEQVLVLYRLWSRLPVFAAAPVEMAQPEGFWTEELELPDVPWQERGLSGNEIRERRSLPGPRRERRTLNGVEYDTVPLLMRAVFPTGAGERELPGPRFEIGIEGARRSFFGPEQVVVAREAPAVTIRAEPLPEAGRPAGFTGAVGDYRLSAEVRRDGSALGDRAAAAGEALVLRVELAGTGNLRAAGTPVLPEGPEAQRAFRFFDPDASSETGLQEEGAGLAFGGRQVWEFPMVPEAGGVRNVAAVTLDVFNPRTGAYEELASDPLRIRVEGAAAAGPGTAGPVGVERFGEDIRYLKPVGPSTSPPASPWRPGPLFALSLALPVLWNLGLVAVRRRRAWREANPAEFRRRGAARAARRNLSRVAAGGPEAAARVAEALADYAAARLGGSRHGLTPESAARRLEEAGATPDTARRFRALLSRSEGARFAASGGGGEAGSDAREAAELIRELETQLGRKGGAG